MGKHNEIKRDKRLVIPVTEEERERIKNVAARTVYKSAANMCREIILQLLPEMETSGVEENMDFVFKKEDSF